MFDLGIMSEMLYLSLEKFQINGIEVISRERVKKKGIRVFESVHVSCPYVMSSLRYE